MTVLVSVLIVMTLTGIFGIVTLALNLQYGQTGIINFGIVAYFAVGAYTYAILTAGPPSDASLDLYRFGATLPVPVAVVIAVFMAGVFAWLTGWSALRLRGEYLALTTFAFAEVLLATSNNLDFITNGPSGFSGVARPFADLIPFDYRYFLAGVAVLSLAVVYFLVSRIVSSPYGRTLNAIRDHEIGVLTSGKRPTAYRRQVFIIGALMTGFAGVLYVWWLTLVRPSSFSASVTFFVWIALVLGGEGSLRGSVAAVAGLLIFDEVVSALPFDSVYAAQLAASGHTVVLGVVFIVILRVRHRSFRGVVKSATP